MSNKYLNVKPALPQGVSPVNANVKLDQAILEAGKTDEGWRFWRNRITQTLLWLERRYWNGHIQWRKAYDIFKGDHWSDKYFIDENSSNPQDRITVNLTGSACRNMVPFLINGKPKFQGKARRPQGNVSAMLQTEILNYTFEVKEMLVEITAAVQDCVIIGHGVIKTGFVLDADIPDDRKEGTINYNDYITKEEPYIKRLNPIFFFFDPTANSLSTAQWCCEIFQNTWNDVVANPRYKKSVLNKIKKGELNVVKRTASIFTTERETYDNMSFLDAFDYAENNIVTLYEIWDKKFRKVYVFAEGCDEPLLEKDWPYDYLKGFPYEIVQFIDVPNEPYGVGLPFAVKDQQYELNRIRTSIFEHRRRFNRKYEAQVNAADEDELDKLTDGEDGTVIMVKQIGLIKPIEDANLTMDTWRTEEVIKADIQELTGQDALLRGGALPSRTTSGEVSTRANVFRLKLETVIDNVDRFILNVGKQVLAHIQANYITDKVVRIVGEQGEYWVKYTPEDIKEEIDVTMSTVSAPKIDEATERQQRIQLFQQGLQAMPLIQQGMLSINLDEMFRWVLDSFGEKDLGRFFKPMLTPLAPLQETPVNPILNNLNPNSAAPSESLNPAPNTPGQPMSAQDIQAQIGRATITNANNLQTG